MKPKNLQEFIEDELARCQPLMPSSNFFVQRSMERLSLHLLEVARERCWDHVCYAEGRLVNHDNPEDAWGEQKSANDLLELLESYCAPVEDLKK